MTNPVRLAGIDEVLKKLNAEITNIKGRTLVGMKKAVFIVRNKAADYTPVARIHGGNLLASQYSDTWMEESGPVGEIGYTADYAMWVHEIDKNYTKPGSSWKYLERALEEERERILFVIAREAEIP